MLDVSREYSGDECDVLLMPPPGHILVPDQRLGQQCSHGSRCSRSTLNSLAIGEYSLHAPEHFMLIIEGR